MKQATRKVTMEDIAKRLNISKNSVSLALGNKSGVGAELRRQIIETAREMNYGGLSNGPDSKSKCIMIIVPEYLHNDAFFYSDIFWSIEKEAKISGCIPINISISREAEMELSLPQFPAEMDITGILVIGIMSDNYVQKLSFTGLPVVTVDISYHNLSVRSITSSNLNGGYTATKHLIQNGHTKIGFIGPIYSAQSVYERWGGFCQAMEEYDLPVTPEFNMTGNKLEFKLFDDIDVLWPFIDGLSEYPTAWFCAGDRIAVALVSILTRKGLRIPDDVSVIGFDDIQMARLIFPALTTMQVDRELMGKLAVNCLLRAEAEDNNNVCYSLYVKLIERDSVKNISR